MVTFSLICAAVLVAVLYKWRLKGFITIAVLLLGLYLAYPFGFWNYKLTLVVETPEGIKTGSAVRKIHAYNEPRIFPENSGFHTGVKGEAVVVDLGERGVLFSLLKGNGDWSDYGYYIIYQEFPYLSNGRSKIWHYTMLEAKKELAFDKIPMLVRFRDINDPKTVELVDPNDLEKTFGKGVKLISATLEMTDENMTTGVEKTLPWLKELNGRYLGGGRTSLNAPLELHGGNFKMGD